MEMVLASKVALAMTHINQMMRGPNLLEKLENTMKHFMVQYSYVAKNNILLEDHTCRRSLHMELHSPILRPVMN